MNLKRLQSFARIVETRSFSDAAESLQLTQSAISKQIKALEDELGVPLLTRNTSSVEPTAIGRRVYDIAKGIAGDWERIIHECRAAAASTRGKLRIGASTVPASYLLPPMVKRLRERHPQLELTVMEGDSEKIVNCVKEGTVDVAFVGSVHPSPQLRWERIVDDRLVIVGAADYPDRREDPLRELLLQPFVIREEGSGTRQAFEEAIRKLGLSPDRISVAAEVSTTESALALAQAGVGVTAVSKWALSGPRELLSLAEIKTDRGFYAAYPISRDIDPLIRLFLHTAQEIYSEQ